MLIDVFYVIKNIVINLVYGITIKNIMHEQVKYYSILPHPSSILPLLLSILSQI